MSNRTRLQVNLGYYDRGHPAQSNDEPGWYLAVPDPTTDGHTWLVHPRRLPADAVRDVAEVLDSHLGTTLSATVERQHAEIISELEAKVASRQRVLASIEEAERRLADLRASLGEPR